MFPALPIIFAQSRFSRFADSLGTHLGVLTASAVLVDVAASRNPRLLDAREIGVGAGC